MNEQTRSSFDGPLTPPLLPQPTNLLLQPHPLQKRHLPLHIPRADLPARSPTTLTKRRRRVKRHRQRTGRHISQLQRRRSPLRQRVGRWQPKISLIGRLAVMFLQRPSLWFLLDGVGGCLPWWRGIRWDGQLSLVAAAVPAVG